MNEIFVYIGLLLLGIVIGLIFTIAIIRFRHKKQSVKILKDARKSAEQLKTDKILQALAPSFSPQSG